MLRRVLVALLSVAGLVAHGVPGGTPMDFGRAGFVGEFHPGTSGRPQYAVLVLGGAEGGVPTPLADFFASQGLPTLALAYFGAKGLPEELEGIPLEYFQKPVEWLLAQPSCRRDGLIVVGWSKGAELSLVLAGREPRIRGVVAIAPSCERWPGIAKDWHRTAGASWTLHGEPLPFLPYEPHGAKNLFDLYRLALAHTADADRARIPVAPIRARVLLLSGGKDDVWPSEAMAETLCARARAAGKGDAFRHVHYPEVGHLLGRLFLKQTGPEAHPARREILNFVSSLEGPGTQPTR